MKLIITNESKEAAQKFWSKNWLKAGKADTFMKLLDVLCVPDDEMIQTAKPLGPGTRLKAQNGDELLIIKSNNGNWGVVNLTKSEVGPLYMPADLIDRLKNDGATVIE